MILQQKIDGDLDKGYVYILYLRITLKAESRKKGKKMQLINFTPLFEDLKTLLLLIWTRAADYSAIWINVGFGFKEWQMSNISRGRMVIASQV